MAVGLPRRVIVAFPRFEARSSLEQLRELQSRFDPLASRVAPHLTLVFPFEDQLDDRALAAHVEKAADALRAFPIILQGITAHEGEYLFLNVKRGNDDLIALHDALYTGPLAHHRARTHTFVPHLTVGRVQPTELAAALDATVNLSEPLTAVVDAVSTYRIDADGSRPILSETSLAHGSSAQAPPP